MYIYYLLFTIYYLLSLDFHFHCFFDMGHCAQLYKKTIQEIASEMGPGAEPSGRPKVHRPNVRVLSVLSHGCII